MAEMSLTNTTDSRSKIAWIRGLFFRPGWLFNNLNQESANQWLVPLLVLSITKSIYVIANGWIKTRLAAMGEIPLPVDWQYWSPDMQNQYMQAVQATQGPIFVYVIPGLMGLAGIWMGWLIFGAMLHLALTVIGGRASVSALNVAAWASLPFAIRDILRVIFVLIVQHPIVSPGLSGFVVGFEQIGILIFSKLLANLDLFIVWYVILLIIGVRSGNSLSRGKAIFAVLLVVSVSLLLQASLGTLASNLGGLMISRPFF